jgi:hypothetical protein
MKYTLIETEFSSYVERLNEDGTTTAIPLNEANSDYQAYLKHEAETK